MEISAVNHNLQPLNVAPVNPAKPTVVSHLDRQAAQTVVQVVDNETKAVQSEVLPEDVLQLGEVVNQPQGSGIL
jgi:uncharacterized FlaG/YvyC family protein